MGWCNAYGFVMLSGRCVIEEAKTRRGGGGGGDGGDGPTCTVGE